MKKRNQGSSQANSTSQNGAQNATTTDWPRANPEDLANFDPSTKVCVMNCGAMKGDPRSKAERRFLCTDCEVGNRGIDNFTESGGHMNIQREEELKPLPCPFCGNKPEWEYHQDPTYPQVECRNIECPIGMTNDQVSLESWNTRQAATEQGDSIPKPPQGFGALAHNKQSGKWLYINHANTWQGCPPPFKAEQGLGEAVYLCHQCEKDIAPPAPFKMYCWCTDCHVNTAATIAEDLGRARKPTGGELIRFDFESDGRIDSKMITHDEMRQRYADLLASNALSYRTGGGVPDENELWSVLEAATEAMNRKALPVAYISLAWNGGAEFITKRRVRAQLATQQPPEQEASFQARVDPWLLECFGERVARDGMERNHRFLEEALELVQSLGCTESEVEALTKYVYGRPAGDPPQEVGGAMVTLAALCLANQLDMHDAGDTELARVWTKIPQIKAKQATKPAMSPLPGVYPDREPIDSEGGHHD